MNSNEIQWSNEWAILVLDLFIASLLQLRFRMYIGNNNLIDRSNNFKQTYAFIENGSTEVFRQHS